MILEAVVLQVRSNQMSAFEAAFAEASVLIESIDGYLSHELHRCLEAEGKYLLLVRWANLAAHTINFRQSAQYQEWKRRLHHFYDPFPIVEHFELVVTGDRPDA